MATNTITGGIRPVTLPNQFPPMPAVSRVMAQFDRSQVEAFVEVAIAVMDLFDGDADLEPETDRGVDDDGEQATWPTNSSQASNGANCMAWDNDDAEDDDPDHEHDGREPDTGGACGEYGIDQDTNPRPPLGRNGRPAIC